MLVVGASSGIGQAIAIAFAQKGVYIFINYRNNKDGAVETLRNVTKFSSNSVRFNLT